MPLTALIVPILAAVAGASAAASEPVIVTGHAWAPFISPMGEPFRAHTPSDDTLADWFRRADQNHDGALSVDEMQADAERFFATLDADHNDVIDPDELINYEWEIAPDIQVMSRTKRAPGDAAANRRSAGAPSTAGDAGWRSDEDDADDPGEGRGRGHRGKRDEGLQGASRYGLLNIPEPVAAADTNFDRGISLDEFREAARNRFKLLDSLNQGRLTLEALEQRRSALLLAGRHPKRGDDSVDTRVGNPLPTGN